MRKRLIFIIPAAIAGIILFTFIGGEVVKLLWNWLTPSLFGWRTIGFWQALGILVLCRILFGGHGLFGRPRHRAWGKMGDRWRHLTPEEREQFRDRIRNRVREKCGFEPDDEVGKI